MGRKNISRGKNKKVTDFSDLFNEINNKKQSEDSSIKEEDKKEG